MGCTSDEPRDPEAARIIVSRQTRSAHARTRPESARGNSADSDVPRFRRLAMSAGVLAIARAIALTRCAAMPSSL